MENNKSLNNQPSIGTGDKRVTLRDEVIIKAELMSNGFRRLIEEFHSAESDEERAGIQEKIHERASNIHATLKSNEP